MVATKSMGVCEGSSKDGRMEEDEGMGKGRERERWSKVFNRLLKEAVRIGAGESADTEVFSTTHTHTGCCLRKKERDSVSLRWADGEK